MAFKFISFFLAVAVIGNIANGASRAKRGGITVISGVDQNGKEYGQVYKYSDDGKSDLVNRFGDEDADVPEAPIGIPNIPDFYFPPIPQIPELPPLNPQLDYNYFLNNYINLFAGMLRKAYQDNLDIYHKTNEVALNAANQLSSKAGLNFQYRPWPEPDYASASAFVNPHDTEIRTAINNPNSVYPNLHDRFNSGDEDVENGKPVNSSVQVFASTSKSGENGRSTGARRAEVVITKNGHVRRFLTKDPIY